MTTLTQTAALVAGIAAGVAGVIYLAGRVRTAARTLEALARVVNRELTHNHGTSIKDDITGMALAVGELGRELDDLRSDVDDLTAAARRHHPEG